MTARPGLTLIDVTERFGASTAVNGVSLEIPEGEFLTLLGPSGSGKTTLLMMIAGFLELTAGDIWLDGRSISAMPPEKRNFGMVFQGYALFPHMSVWENIAYPLEVRRRPRREIQKRVGEMLALVQLDGLGERKPNQLSGGQQQRTALARALCFSPPVLLLDEPLGALDRKLRVEVQEQLKAIHRQVGATFLYVTHDQEEALSMSDRIVIMRDGGVEQIGAPADLYERPRTEFVASFLGRSNFLRGHHGVFALRPEKIDIHPKAFGGRPPRLTGTIREISYVGATKRISVFPDDGTQAVDVDIDTWRVPHAFDLGQKVDLDWKDEAAVKLER